MQLFRTLEDKAVPSDRYFTEEECREGQVVGREHRHGKLLAGGEIVPYYEVGYLLVTSPLGIMVLICDKSGSSRVYELVRCTARDDYGWGGVCGAVVLQPRRLAASSISIPEKEK